ncbi:Qat anti-phage system TatD family nuclease QatD [Marinifilum fragile]|uniref:Qat anti-phage system TatD family nuclease QatD n=1 Tax=Marinifilum fragile TaxID=570161 RepID=UPI0006D0B57A|nr:Qat anti-phage system TatD family nuclease QatD [Marinifilum fragile]
MIIDTHCHYDMFENPTQIVRDCEQKQIVTIGMTNLPSHFEMGYPHIKGYKYIRMALGLHPLMAKEHDRELVRFKKNIDNTSYIGEVGLDFSRDGISTKDIQISSFEYVLATIKSKEKIVSLHSRRAEKEVLELLKKYEIKNAIFHWYSGGVKILREILENGYYFSINPAMVKSKSGQKLIAEIPLDRILTETDSPYTQIGSRTTEPSDVKIVISYLSESKGMSAEVVENKIYSNFKTLINKIR